MLQASFRLYRNAYSGLPNNMWWLSLVLLINRSGTMVIPFLTVYLIENGYSVGQAGWVMAAFGTGGIVGAYVGGQLSSRLGFYKVQLYSLLSTGLLFFVLEQLRGLWQIGFCLFVIGVVGEAFRPANSAAIAAFSNEQNRIRCFALNRLAVNLGWAVGPAMGGILSGISYSFLFWMDGITCITAAFILWFFLSPKRTGYKQPVIQSGTENVGSAYKDKPFLAGMFLLFLVTVCFFQLFNMVSVFYKNHLLLPKATIGWVLGLNGLIIALFEMVLVYKLEKRNHGMWYIIAGSVFIGLSFLALLAYGGLAVAITSIVVITIGEMLLFPFINNFWVKRSTEQNRSQYAAANTITFALGHVLAPIFAGQIAMHYSFQTLWIINCALCIIAAVGFLKLQKHL